MKSWKQIIEQTNKPRLKPTSIQWLHPEPFKLPKVQSNGSSSKSYDFPTIMGQLNKKRISRRSQKNRLADKSILLADVLRSNSYK
jgi:hypothetical protein